MWLTVLGDVPCQPLISSPPPSCSLHSAAPAARGRREESLATTEGAAAAALREADAVDKLGETRWASKAPAGAAAPSFVVDASWPKPLPNNWRIGQVGGIAVDSHDNIWVYHRPRTLDASSAGAMPRTATNDQGVPISALGHPRPYAERSTGCCVPAPSVLKFDREGNLLTAWGGPSDPGFLDENCREADGCFWPAREHGIFVDHNDFVYVVRQRRGRRVAPATGRWRLTRGRRRSATTRTY